MRAHTITTQAGNGGGGRMKRRIVPGGILGLGLTVVLLGATASTASAAPVLYPWGCAPPSILAIWTPSGIPQGCLDTGFYADSFNFGYHRLGTSGSQSFALGVSNDTFTPSVSVSGEKTPDGQYTQTNNCPPTLSAGAWPQTQGCLITVTFAPTGKGRHGQRRARGILSTGPGGPEQALYGTGYLGTSVRDPRRDRGCDRGREAYEKKPCLDSAMRSADIVRVTADHEGGRLRHTIRVVGKFQSGGLVFSPDPDRNCEWWLTLERGKRKVEFRNLQECRHQEAAAGPGGRAKIEFHRHSVEVVFRESQIGNPDGYGWQAWTVALGPPDRGRAYDDVPDGVDGYVFHELG
jgi:hypothetical protein